MSVEDLAQAVSLQQTAALTRIPGIGAKTAARLLLELNGKLGAALDGAGSTAAAGGDALGDILRALIALGYSEREAGAATRQVPAGSGVSDGIRLALQSLAKG
jgi:Holliday junction DNA helicase RuvA